MAESVLIDSMVFGKVGLEGLGDKSVLVHFMDSTETDSHAWLVWEEIYAGEAFLERLVSLIRPETIRRRTKTSGGEVVEWIRGTGTRPYIFFPYNGHTLTWLASRFPKSAIADLRCEEVRPTSLLSVRPLSFAESDMTIFAGGNQDNDLLAITCSETVVPEVMGAIRRIDNSFTTSVTTWDELGSEPEVEKLRLSVINGA